MRGCVLFLSGTLAFGCAPPKNNPAPLTVNQRALDSRLSAARPTPEAKVSPEGTASREEAEASETTWQEPSAARSGDRVTFRKAEPDEEHTPEPGLVPKAPDRGLAPERDHRERRYLPPEGR
jgi:hypothetical protein